MVDVPLTVPLVVAPQLVPTGLPVLTEQVQEADVMPGGSVSTAAWFCAPNTPGLVTTMS
ncbi:hypothetical protein D9M69_713150 [compost metagenome]